MAILKTLIDMPNKQFWFNIKLVPGLESFDITKYRLARFNNEEIIDVTIHDKKKKPLKTIPQIISFAQF